MNALLFADGGRQVGLGHLRRCLALATGFSGSGWDWRFLTDDSQARAWLKSRGAPVADGEDAGEGRLPRADYACDLFVLDSYRVSGDDVRRSVAGRARCVLAFDDHFNRHDTADILLNAGVKAPLAAWPGRGRLTHLLGPAYQPLPPEFRSARRPAIGRQVARVLVTLGGSGDSAALSAAVRAVRRSFPQARIDCILGPFSGAAPEISGVALHRDPPAMLDLMLACDLAVSAGGQTLFELAASGTPAIAFAISENQLSNVDGMVESGVALRCDPPTRASFEDKLISVLGMLSPAEARERMAEAGRRLVDGNGAGRVVDAVESFFRHQVDTISSSIRHANIRRAHDDRGFQ
jgi:spore coat polysaccharide biosynthesis predicted glycosyltransferase SpsG